MSARRILRRETRFSQVGDDDWWVTVTQAPLVEPSFENINDLQSNRPGGSAVLVVRTKCRPYGAASQLPFPDSRVQADAAGQDVFVDDQGVPEAVVGYSPRAMCQKCKIYTQVEITSTYAWNSMRSLPRM